MANKPTASAPAMPKPKSVVGNPNTTLIARASAALIDWMTVIIVW